MTADKRKNVAYQMQNDSRQNYQAVIFDLDGTLWDSCESCAAGWNEQIQQLGVTFRLLEAEDIRRVAGLPHAECIAQIFASLSVEEQQRLEQATASGDLHAIRQRGAHIYPGVAAGLRQLAEQGPLFLVSNCQTGYIELFLEISKLENVFLDSLCWGQTGLPKRENLRILCQRYTLTHALYIGDTQGDAEAAAAAGLDFWHAAWGFGQVLSNTPACQNFSALVEKLEGRNFAH